MTEGEIVAAAAEQPERWGIVELMGHARLAGRLSVDTSLGCALLRVDVPEIPGVPAWTKMVGPPSIYAVTPVSEQIARGVAVNIKARPVSVYDVHALAEDRGLRLPFADPDDSGLEENQDDPF